MENKIHIFEEFNKSIKFGKLSPFNDVLKSYIEFTQLLNFKDLIDDSIIVPHRFYLMSVKREGKRCIKFLSNSIFSIKNYHEFHISERAKIKILSLKIYAKFMRYMHKYHKLEINEHSSFDILEY